MTPGGGGSGSWTPADLGDLSGRTALVTGANSGIGFSAACGLARAGAHVVLACRDATRGDEALGQVRVQVPRASVELRRLDLADLSSVRGLASSWLGPAARLDLLVNNAGVMATPHRRTADGFELQLGTNHLGHFALTGLLLPALLATSAEQRDVRVVTVASLAHHAGRLDRADLMHERRYRRWAVYGQAKLANLLFAFELHRRLQAAGAAVLSVAAHPGLTATNLIASGPLSGLPGVDRLGTRAASLLMQGPEAGSWPLLRAATDPDLEGGEYIGPSGPGETRGAPVLVGASAAAHSADDAGWLWQRSEELTGVRYPLAAAG